MNSVAIEYAYQKALKLNMPIVINGSVGSNSSADFTEMLSTAESTYYNRGICLVDAAGNEGDTQTHIAGIIPLIGDKKEVELELGEDEDEIEVQVWIDRPYKVDITVISPTGEESKSAGVSNYNKVKGIFDLEGTSYAVTYIFPSPFSGQQFTKILLTNAKKGIWKIRLSGNNTTAGWFDMYLPNRVFIKKSTKFRESKPNYTINYPATFDDVITVGAFNTKINSIWPSSSRGPNLAGVTKPDITGPGVNIIAPYPGNTYAMISGTSAAAAHVSAAAAMFFQYTLVDGNYENKAFTHMIKSFMAMGAKKMPDITYPDYTYGYGLLNVRGMFDQLK
jgi:subtilisin family serine protease